MMMYRPIPRRPIELVFLGRSESTKSPPLSSSNSSTSYEQIKPTPCYPSSSSSSLEYTQHCNQLRLSDDEDDIEHSDVDRGRLIQENLNKEVEEASDFSITMKNKNLSDSGGSYPDSLLPIQFEEALLRSKNPSPPQTATKFVSGIAYLMQQHPQVLSLCSSSPPPVQRSSLLAPTLSTDVLQREQDLLQTSVLVESHCTEASLLSTETIVAKPKPLRIAPEYSNAILQFLQKNTENNNEHMNHDCNYAKELSSIITSTTTNELTNNLDSIRDILFGITDDMDDDGANAEYLSNSYNSSPNNDNANQWDNTSFQTATTDSMSWSCSSATIL